MSWQHEHWLITRGLRRVHSSSASEQKFRCESRFIRDSAMGFTSGRAVTVPTAAAAATDSALESGRIESQHDAGNHDNKQSRSIVNLVSVPTVHRNSYRNFPSLAKGERTPNKPLRNQTVV